MKSAYLLLLLALLCCCNAYSQAKLKYRSQNFVGLVEGEAKASFQLQTIHGVQYRTWYGALGAGLDYYLYRSVPVFLTINKDLVIKDRTFYVSGDVGTNYPWVQQTQMSIWGSPSTGDFSEGLYWAGGLGYKAFFKNKSDAIVINLGYSYKHLRQKITYPSFCTDGPCGTTSEKFNYQLNRVSFRLGWQF
jgi:hypothetical protein